jgi:hypothetical protein
MSVKRALSSDSVATPQNVPNPKQQKKCDLFGMPVEIGTMILSQLDYKPQSNLAKVSKDFNNFVNENSVYLFKKYKELIHELEQPAKTLVMKMKDDGLSKNFRTLQYALIPNYQNQIENISPKSFNALITSIFLKIHPFLI